MPDVAAQPYVYTFTPATAALLVIDMQRDFIEPGGFGEALGNDTSRDWRQNALLAVNGTNITLTPTYYVFRHLSQYVVPGANV